MRSRASRGSRRKVPPCQDRSSSTTGSSLAGTHFSPTSDPQTTRRPAIKRWIKAQTLPPTTTPEPSPTSSPTPPPGRSCSPVARKAATNASSAGAWRCSTSTTRSAASSTPGTDRLPRTAQAAAPHFDDYPAPSGRTPAPCMQRGAPAAGQSRRGGRQVGQLHDHHHAGAAFGRPDGRGVPI